MTAKSMAFSLPMDVHSKFACAGFQAEAVDDWGRTVKTYDLAMQWPGGWPGFRHCVGMWENSGWPRSLYGHDALDAPNNCQHQEAPGRESRPRAGTSGNSCGYWQNWYSCVFEFA